MSRLDVFKSWVRAGLDDARERLDGVGPFGMVDRIKRELDNQGGVVPERAITLAVAHIPGTRVASVTARRGHVHVHATYEGVDEALEFHLEPFGCRFAPRGAKEIVFRVTPVEAATHPKARVVVGAVAASVAHGLWGIVLGRPEGDISGAIVDRDGPDSFRVDLRTVPTVRAAVKRQAAALVVDVLELRRIDPMDGELRLRLKLPAVVGR